MLELFLDLYQSILSLFPAVLYLFSLFIIGGVLISILEELTYNNVLNTQLNKDKLEGLELKPTKMQKYFVLRKMEKK